MYSKGKLRIQILICDLFLPRLRLRDRPDSGSGSGFTATQMTMNYSLCIVFRVKQGLWWRAVVEQLFSRPKAVG